MAGGPAPVTTTETRTTTQPVPAVRDDKQRVHKKEAAHVKKLEQGDNYKKEDRKLETVVKGQGSQPPSHSPDKDSTEEPSEKPVRVERTKGGVVHHYKPIHVGDKFATRALNDRKTVEAARKARRGELKIAREKVIRITVGGSVAKQVASPTAPSLTKATNPSSGAPVVSLGSPTVSSVGTQRTPFKGAMRFGCSYSGYVGGTEATTDYSAPVTYKDEPVTTYSSPTPSESSPAATLVFDVSGVNRGGTIVIVDHKTGRVVKTITLKPGQKIQRHTLPVPKGDYDIKVRAAKTRSASKDKDPDPEKDDLDNITVKVKKIEGGGAEAPKEPAAKK